MSRHYSHAPQEGAFGQPFCWHFQAFLLWTPWNSSEDPWGSTAPRLGTTDEDTSSLTLYPLGYTISLWLFYPLRRPEGYFLLHLHGASSFVGLPSFCREARQAARIPGAHMSSPVEQHSDVVCKSIYGQTKPPNFGTDLLAILSILPGNSFWGGSQAKRSLSQQIEKL